jgi:hypothetical protein
VNFSGGVWPLPSAGTFIHVKDERRTQRGRKELLANWPGEKNLFQTQRSKNLLENLQRIF